MASLAILKPPFPLIILFSVYHVKGIFTDKTQAFEIEQKGFVKKGAKDIMRTGCQTFNLMRGILDMTRKAIVFLTALILGMFSADAFAAQAAPSPFSAGEINSLELKEGYLASGAMEAAPAPFSAEEMELYKGLEAASGIDPDSVTAGSSVIDLVIVVLLVYLILRLLG